MKKCKNIECETKIEDKRTYCSLTCRNVYVNKYLRDYSKCSQTQREKYRIDFIPNKCIVCNTDIPFEKKKNKYCSHSCAASITNLGRIESEETKKKKRESLLSKYHQIDFKKRKCKVCENEFYMKESTGKRYCSIECRRSFQRKDLTEYQKYRLDARFNFNVFHYPDDFDLSLIEKYGMYKAKNRGDNLNGISRDHMYSIRDGFDNKIDVTLISHPANCRLIFQKDNASKHRKSIITFEELMERIDIWNMKKLTEQELKVKVSNAWNKIFNGEDEVYENGVLVRNGDWVLYTSHEGYDQLNEEVIKKLKEEINGKQ